MSDFKKYIPKKHKEWSLLLKKFHNLIRDYNTPPIDVAYWYGERALTGFLSAAAWKMHDGWSLEEFTGLRRKKRKNSSGRGDLWMGIGSKRFTVEAKIVWIGNMENNLLKPLQRAMNAAYKQLKCLDKEYQVGIPTTICYIVPELNKSAANDTKRLFHEFTSRLMEDEPKTVVGAFWYEKRIPEHGDKIYPGVIVVIKQWEIW